MLKFSAFISDGKRSQGRINHCANRANARGLAHGYQNTPLLVFRIFRLFTTRQNGRAFWLLGLVYRSRKLITLAFIVFEWLKRIEPNSTTLYDPRFRSKSVHPWTSAEIFTGWGQRRIFLLTLYRLLTRGPVVPFRPLKICVSISYLAPRLLHTSNIIFKKYFPRYGFWPPLLRNPGDGSE